MVSGVGRNQVLHLTDAMSRGEGDPLALELLGQTRMFGLSAIRRSFMLWSVHGRCSGTRGVPSRCRSSAAGAPPDDNEGSNWEHRGGNRP